MGKGSTFHGFISDKDGDIGDIDDEIKEVKSKINNIMVKVQEWLDENYPKAERKNITELRIRQKNLEGHLNLQDFVSLEFLDCSQNQLTSLDLSKNLKLEVVNIYDNKIIRADYAKLDIFSHLVNLQKLDLGYNIDKQEQEARKRSLLLK
jgi:Leucine-rich repeat (LRR) protein